MTLFSSSIKREKIFCIGRNKTGTTSLEQVLKEFGYKVGSQTEGERLVQHYKNYNWKPIVKFCRTAEAFQDAPFSWPYTWLLLHHYYPSAKFILTIREEELWYHSQVKFHAEQFSDGKEPPTKQEMLEATYNYKGYLYEMFKAVWKTSDEDLYNKNEMINNYRSHNHAVLNYFKGNSNFLVIDVAKEQSYDKICKFLNKDPQRNQFPHLNRSR